MNTITERTEQISNEILDYISEGLPDFFSPVTYVPHVKKGIETGRRGLEKILPKQMQDLLVEPEMGKGGWQKPGVLRTVAAMMAPQVHGAMMDKGAAMGASQGVVGGGLGGGALGAFAGRSWASDTGPKARTAKGRAGRAIWNLIKRLGGTATGAATGTAAGAISGGIAGGMRGRAAGSAILGGGIGAAVPALVGAALPAALLPSLPVIPALAAAFGGLGAALGSDVMKKVWDVRGQAAQGGPTYPLSQSPMSRRTGR